MRGVAGKLVEGNGYLALFQGQEEKLENNSALQMPKEAHHSASAPANHTIDVRHRMGLGHPS